MGEWKDKIIQVWHESKIFFMLVSDTVCIDMFFIAVIVMAGMIELNHSLINTISISFNILLQIHLYMRVL